MKKIRFIDLFAGIGGFRYGLEKAGEHIQRTERGDIRPNGNKSNLEGRSDKQSETRWDRKLKQSQNSFECVYSNEWDKYASQIYKKYFGECDTTDITKVSEKEIPDHDLLCAGFPCQSFSIAGKRGGFNDTRGTMFFEIARVAAEKRPRYLLLENVKGLLSHDQGKTFQTILGVLSDLGYRVEWQVLNSKHFGVPQNRERVFIVGHLGGGSGQQIFPIGGQGKDDNRGLGEQTSYTLDANYYKGVSPKGYQSSKRQLITHGGIKIRRLTPTECARLQGFPDDWCEGLSDTQQYKCYGNAVTTNVITAIGEKLLWREK